MMLLPENYLKERNLDMSIKQKRNLPIIRLICIIFASGYVGYGTARYELGIWDWYTWLVAGLVLTIAAGLIWRKEKTIEKTV